jgi:hypothetical protein
MEMHVPSDDVDWYYVDVNNVDHGPVKHAAFANISFATVDEESAVWNHLMDDWHTIGELYGTVPAFFAHVLGCDNKQPQQQQHQQSSAAAAALPPSYPASPVRATTTTTTTTLAAPLSPLYDAVAVAEPTTPFHYEADDDAAKMQQIIKANKKLERER